MKHRGVKVETERGGGKSPANPGRARCSKAACGPDIPAQLRHRNVLLLSDRSDAAIWLIRPCRCLICLATGSIRCVGMHLLQCLEDTDGQ